MLIVSYVTSNEYKFQVAQEALKDTDIKIVQNPLDTPEIQSNDVSEIASFSARWAADHLQTPCLVSDVGYFIKSLNGFPGPFIKWTNKWLTSADYLRLLQNSTDRSVEIRECLAFCRPNGEAVCFINSYIGTLATKAGPKGYSPIDEIFIPNGFDKVETEIPREIMVKYWSKNSTKWQQFVKYIQSQQL